MDRAIAGIIIAATLAIAACTTIGKPAGYVICNDLAANSNCPDKTANVVIGM